MMQSRFHTRLQRLERRAHAQEDGILYVWRLPEESAAEACVRCAVDPGDFPQVQVHVWRGGQASTRLAQPPAPLWVSRTPPAIDALEHRLHEAARRVEEQKRQATQRSPA